MSDEKESNRGQEIKEIDTLKEENIYRKVKSGTYIRGL